ncbi:efflux RND transporter periplasmic adaptor subunit [Marinobacter zhejiangensis]|uniref:Membrane fusion protein, multidrug efflux system n=1 Tax=Marinobacter zhejiangensis TaxID=488535 RepID=A0A1I4T371_9GAMM|nr:efflux RND transporter periplasmic adaptor subunit [Marinobacter zhejiangensis]SFM71075.1 membrane fusion protein, multidrug efflux system [Marinobacter zhejiangensis]
MAHFPRSFTAVSCLIVTSLLLTACDNPQQQTSSPPPAVTVYTVASQPIGDYREFVARTSASQEVDLRARVEGEITQINFTEGGTVEAGQLLFEIDPKPYQAALERARADLSAARASATQAAADFQRGQELSPRGFISQSDLDKLRAATDQTKASVEGAQALLEEAQLNLGYTSITAPFDGQIGKHLYDVGTLVGPSSAPLATLQSIDPIFVDFQLEEGTYVSYLQQQANNTDESGQPALDLSLRLPNNEIYGELGSLNFADTRIDSTVGSVNIRAEFPNPDGLILPGLYVTLIAESQDKAEAPLIPQSSVQESQLGFFVLTLNDQSQIEQTIVTMGRRIGAMWVVESGLDSGQQIVIEGLQKVRSGITVTAVEKTVDPQTGVVMDLPGNQ